MHRNELARIAASWSTVLLGAVHAGARAAADRFAFRPATIVAPSPMDNWPCPFAAALALKMEGNVAGGHCARRGRRWHPSANLHLGRA